MDNGIRNTECGIREMHAEGVGGLRVSTLGLGVFKPICPGGAPGTPFEGASWKHTRSRRNQLWRPFRAPRVKCGNPGLKPISANLNFLDDCLPRRGRRTQPGVLTPGAQSIKRLALKGPK